jgi:predicted alpha/beta superfamily hydrolase
MKKLLVLLLYLLSVNAFTQTAIRHPLPRVVSGTIQRIENFQSKFVDARNIDIWLPEGYNANEKYAVLYMHDGQALYDSTTTWNHQEWGVDDIAGELIRQKKVQPFIVVGIWNSDAKRHIDYFPQKPFEALSSSQQDSIYTANNKGGRILFPGKIQSDRYLKFIVSELKPFIDSVYSTLKGPSNTFIAGSSMGGLISMYAICEYPKIFGGAACLSTHWPGVFTMENNPIPDAFLNYMRTHLPDPKHHKIYFDYGDQTLDAMYPPLQAKVDEVMDAKGYTSKNWVTKYFPGESHSEMSWHKRLDIPLLFLLKK